MTVAQTCPATVTDVDGNSYAVVSIGAQCWFAENLRVGHYRTGWPIMSGLTAFEWENTTIGAYHDVGHWGAGYGKFYNWYAVADPRGICPEGWHVADNAEWAMLVDALGGEAVASDALRTLDWSPPDAGATNASGFAALPAGYRHWQYGAPLYPSGTEAVFWTSTATDDLLAVVRGLYRNPQVVTYADHDIFSLMGNAMPCRCIRSATTGVSASSVEEDIRVYPNPASDRLVLERSHGHPADWVLLDATGRAVRTGVARQTSTVLDLAGLPAGLYVLRVEHLLGFRAVQVHKVAP